MAIEYVVFDMDGLLIDSEKIYTLVTNKILEPYGVSMSWEIKAGCMGKPEREASLHLLGSFPAETLTPPGLPPLTLESYIKQRNELQDQMWPFVALLPGAARLVRHLNENNIPCVIATGSRRRNYLMKTRPNAGHLDEEKSKLFSEFDRADRVVCADDNLGIDRQMNGKPAPDIFLAAAGLKLGRSVGWGEADSAEVSEAQKEERKKGLVFEDAIPGVQAAKRAGMKVVWVPDPNILTEGGGTQEAQGMADLIITSLEQFVPEEWGLPGYKD